MRHGRTNNLRVWSQLSSVLRRLWLNVDRFLSTKHQSVWRSCRGIHWCLQALVHLIFEGKVDNQLLRNAWFLLSTWVHHHYWHPNREHYLFSTRHSIKSRQHSENISISVHFQHSSAFIWIVLVNVSLIVASLAQKKCIKVQIMQFAWSDNHHKQCHLWGSLTQKLIILSKNHLLIIKFSMFEMCYMASLVKFG